MKKALKILFWILLVIIVLVGALVVYMDKVIETSFNTVVPKVLGVEARLDDATVHLLKGYTALNGIHIGNPEGFHTDGLFDLDEVRVRIDPASLAGDGAIVINEIAVKGMKVTYEQGLTQNNIGALLDNLPKSEKEEKKEEPEEEKGPSRPVIIEKLDIVDCSVDLSVTLAKGGAMNFELPEIHLTDLGKENGGVTTGDVIGIVVESILNLVKGTVAGAGKLVTGTVGLATDGVVAAAGAIADGASAAGSVIADGASAATDAIAGGAAAAGGAIVDGAGVVADSIGDTVGAAADGAAAVGGALADGAAAAGSAIADGASAVTEGIGAVAGFLNPFGGDDKDEESK